MATTHNATMISNKVNPTAPREPQNLLGIVKFIWVEGRESRVESRESRVISI